MEPVLLFPHFMPNIRPIPIKSRRHQQSDIKIIVIHHEELKHWSWNSEIIRGEWSLITPRP
ncbi:hypothetical protein PR048_019784 [Dryococelus australis]|uniref:Uncharacterized protein n=1 Tax=Dryococelus australis TaxID=614101 RepID=A0ABQ9H4G4_9NEOP|nr:hypothetical protein PR048_019784 [Dryococelus australis]